MSEEISLNDLSRGLNEWRNIQDVLRNTFKAVFRQLEQHSDAIKNLEQLMVTKASVGQVDGELSRKLNRVDFDEKINETFRALDRKANSSDVSLLLEAKVNRTDIRSLEAALEKRADVGYVSNLIEQQNSAINQIQAEIGQKANAADVAVELEQKATISAVNDALSQKANKQAVAAALHKKANKLDVETWLTKKADLNEVNSALAGKSDADTINAALELRPTKTDVSSYVESRSGEVRSDVLNQVHESLAPLRSELSKKINYSECESLLQGKSNLTDLEVVRGDFQTAQQMIGQRLDLVQDSVTGKVNRTDFIEWSEKTERELQSHYNEIESTVRDRNNAFEDQLRSQAQSVSGAMRIQQAEIQKFVDTSEITLKKQGEDLASLRADTIKLYSNKADIHVVQQKMDQESGRNLILQVKDELLGDIAGCASSNQMRNNILDLQHKIEEQDAALRRLVSSIDSHHDGAITDQGRTLDTLVREVEGFSDRVRNLEKEAVPLSKVEQVTDQVKDKANVSDVCALLDMKSNVEDVNKALSEIGSELDQKASDSELRQVVERQSLINDSLSQEHAIARFVWKSGRTKSNGAVPWNVQAVNTNPDNFHWEKDRSIVQISLPGLYEVSFGFFGRRRPTIQLIVNGEPVLSALNTTSAVVHHPPRAKSIGCITGQTLIDYLSLPPGAKLQLLLANGEHGTEGFLCLKKL